MKYKTKLTLFLATVCLLGFSQNENEHHKKYWYYKSRLNNDFIKIGLDTGESIPFNSRGSKENDFYENGWYARYMGCGDATTRLGIYLAVLATEYKLLKISLQDVSKVKHEIFCALNAINRSDYVAEHALDNTKSNSLNGFFIRGDVPKNFLRKNYKHFNYYNNGTNANGNPLSPPNDKGFTQTFSWGQDTVITNYPTSVDEDEESQDQLYYLLMGLTLTNKLVDANETDNNNVFPYENTGETKLAKEAEKIAERLINYVKSDPFWIIRNPNTGSPVTRGYNAMPYAYALDNLGDFITNNEELPYCHASINPFALSGMTPVAIQNLYSAMTAYPYTQSGSYRNLYSASPAASTAYQGLAVWGGGYSPDWQGFYNILAGCGNNVYESAVLKNVLVENTINALQQTINAFFTALNNGVQNILNYLSGLPFITPQVQSWAQNAINNLNATVQSLISAAQSALSIWLQYLFVTVNINTTDSRLKYNSEMNPVFYANCQDNNQFAHSHLGSGQYFGIYLRDILHGHNNNIPNWLQWLTNTSSWSSTSVKQHVKTMLDEAPCLGDYNFGLGNIGPISIPSQPSSSYWGGNNFIDRPDRLWKKTTCPNFLGEYSGTDYMLLHNLYYLTEGLTSYAMHDYIDRKVYVDYPYNNYFTHSNPRTFGAFEKITSDKAIAANGNATFRAGKEVELLPGFSVAQGGEFNLQIEPYNNCAYVNQPLHRSASGSQNADDFGSYGNDENTTAPTHTTQAPVKAEIPKNTQLEALMNNQINTLNKEIEKVMNELKAFQRIEIYPNPNSGSFDIKFSLEKEDDVNIQVSDVLGRIVFEEKHRVGNHILPVNLGNNTTKGMYFVKIKFSDGKEETKKITIQ